MAQKQFLEDREAEVHTEAKKAMDAWHEDRKEWSDRALRMVTLVNAGGAVTATAFIGTFVGASPTPVSVPEYSLLCLGSFIIGLVLPLGYIMYRFLWAEYRVWYLRFKRRDLWDADKQVDPDKIMTKRPPTRPQLFFTYICNGGSLLFFLGGIGLGMKGLSAF